MGTQPYNLESGHHLPETQSPPPEVVEPLKNPVEIVEAATSQEIMETLIAGASIVVSKDLQNRTVEDDTLLGGEHIDHNHPIKILYLAGKREVMDGILASGLFGNEWKIDEITYAPFICLKAQDIGPTSLIYKNLNTIFGKNATLDRTGNYIWNKRHNEAGQSNLIQ